VDFFMQRARGTDRLLDILDYCETLSAPISRHALAEALKCPRSTVYVLVDQLVERGWLEQTKAKDVVLGHRAAMLGLAYGKHARFDRNMRTAVDRLARETGEVVEVNIVDRWQQLVLMSATGTEPNYLRAAEGSLFPLPQTASGLVLLECASRAAIEKNIPRKHFCLNNGVALSVDAFMKQISEASARGYALGRGLIKPYIGTICTAVRNKEGLPIAGLCIVMPVADLDRRLEILLPILAATADDLTKALTVIPWPMGERVLQEIRHG